MNKEKGGDRTDKNLDNAARKALGLPYRYDDPALLGDQYARQDKMRAYNNLLPSDTAGRKAMLPQIFAEVGENCFVEQPLNSNWGCSRVKLGAGVYINSNATFVDDAEITIGDNSLIAPNVVISTSGHPVLPELRARHFVYNLPVHIGKNVWIGSGAQICPGVTIGDNSVIGAGSVVTSDIPADTVAYGVPCKVIRPIGARDREFYFKDRRLDID